jgi:hypothetical protein
MGRAFSSQAGTASNHAIKTGSSRQELMANRQNTRRPYKKREDTMSTTGTLGSIFSPTFIGWVTDPTKSTQLGVNVIGALMILAGLLIASFWPFPEPSRSR